MSSLIVALAMTTLPFVDEAPRDASLTAFRHNLVAAVRRGNWKWVDARIDPAIRYTFGDNDGKKGFLKQWGNNRKSLAHELTAVLSLGGSFLEKSFWAPYVHSTWPEDIDPFGFVAVIGKDVPLLDADNREISRLDHEVVEASGEERGGMISVKVGDKTGWVARKSVRSPLEYRACLSKQKGSWYLTAFVAGD